MNSIYEGISHFMPVFSYHCVNCGALLTPEDIVFDVSAIAFFGALPGDYSRLPIYMTADELAERFTWNDGKGFCNITLKDWISLLYEQCGDQLDPGTREENADAAYLKYHELLKKQKEQEEYSFTSYQIAVIPGLPDNLSRILTGNCADEEKCRCTIKFDTQYGYTIVDYAGRTNSTSFTDQRRCRQCHSSLLERAFQCEQTLIGFIGFQKVGKTCLIAALCKHLDYAAPGCQLLLRPSDERLFRRELKRYANGFALKKTATDGQLKVNPTIYMQDGERPARMLTFVVIAGEAFNNDEGRFDPSMMENNFRAIADCSLYVFCTSLSAFETAEFGSMQRSLENFVNHLSRSKEGAAPSPMMIAVMQMDEPTTCIENRKDVPYVDEEYLFGREYNQIYNIRESEQIKNAVSGENGRKLIDRRLQSFLASVSALLYNTPITCSAYGRQPVSQIVVFKDSDYINREIKAAILAKRPVQIIVSDFSGGDALYETYQNAYGDQKELVEIIRKGYDDADPSEDGKLSEAADLYGEQAYDTSMLRFSPKPRNMELLYHWMMRMIGEMEIPSRSGDKTPLAAADLRGLSLKEFHTGETEVQAIARMFVNPHKFDRKLYKISQSPPFVAKLQKHAYLSEMEKAKAKGEPLLN